jgi:DNA-binding NarL/FixJ family response regulator
MAPIKILIADDHRMFREGLRSALETEDFEIVGEAEDGRQAVHDARRLRPQIAILDISMPGLNGVDATREILRESPETRVIVLTMHKEEPYVAAALRAGARGYVLKSDGVARLAEAIREVARGEVSLAHEFWRPLVESYQRGEDLAADRLSPREREVVQLIAEGKTTREIAEALNISFKTADSHRTHIMAKLDIHDLAGIVRYAIRNRLIQA